MRDLGSSRKPDSSTGAGSVKREALVGGTGAADMLFRQKAIGAAADDLGNRLEGRGRRQALRHDGGHVSPGSGKGLRQMRKGALQTEPHRPIVGRRQFVGCGYQRTGKTDARCKTADAGDDVACEHRLLVVKA
jgi:hypothetical protein